MDPTKGAVPASQRDREGVLYHHVLYHYQVPERVPDCWARVGLER